MLDHLQEFFYQMLPGIIGSTGAALWTKGGKRRVASLWILGIAVAYYVGPYIAGVANMPESVTGLIVGFFGMAIIDKVFEGIAKFDLANAFNKLVDRFLGKGN